MIGVRSARRLEITLCPSPILNTKAVYAKFRGKMYPTGKPHPVVTKIVGAETLAQIQHLHDKREAKYRAAVDLLRWRRRRAAGLEKQVDAAKDKVRKASDAGAKETRKAALEKIDVELYATNLEIVVSEKHVADRKHKTGSHEGKTAPETVGRKGWG